MHTFFYLLNLQKIATTKWWWLFYKWLNGQSVLMPRQVWSVFISAYVHVIVMLESKRFLCWYLLYLHYLNVYHLWMSDHRCQTIGFVLNFWCWNGRLVKIEYVDDRHVTLDCVGWYLQILGWRWPRKKKTDDILCFYFEEDVIYVSAYTCTCTIRCITN